VGKTYQFKTKISVRYPCFREHTGDQNPDPFFGGSVSGAQYTCQNNPSITHNIPNKFETFEITVTHTIPHVAETYGIFDGTWLSERPCCASPENPAPEGCCSCYTNSYSYCTMGDGLEDSCAYTPQFPPDYWRDCYRSWVFKTSYDTFQITTIPGSGGFSTQTICSIIPGDDNLARSHTTNIRFIPNPNNPEQLDPNYIPRVQPKIFGLKVLCARFYDLPHVPDPTFGQPESGYAAMNIINLEIGFGYRHTFNCGGDTQGNTVLETLNIPFNFIPFAPNQPLNNQFANGPFFSFNYGRLLNNNDSINACLSVSSKNILGPSIIQDFYNCNNQPIYSDEYSRTTYNYTMFSSQENAIQDSVLRRTGRGEMYPSCIFFDGPPLYDNINEFYCTHCDEVNYYGSSPQCEYIQAEPTIEVKLLN
jgi:hypothetical protein